MPDQSEPHEIAQWSHWPLREDVPAPETIAPVSTTLVSRRGQARVTIRRGWRAHFRIEQTFSAATEPGEDLQTSLDARAPGFGAESVTAGLNGDEWKVKATFQGVETREEAEARLGALLEASGFPPSATSSGATEIVDVTEETSPD
jgi:hypothetical protein